MRWNFLIIGLELPRHFDQNSALLLALLTGVAVAEALPAVALGMVFVGLALQSLKVLSRWCFSLAS